MRILHVPPGFYPKIGGVENHARGWARQQVAAGHEVTVVAPRDGAPPVGTVDGIAVRRVRSLVRLGTAEVTPALPLRLLTVPTDVIHTYFPMPWNADWGVIIGRLRRKPVVFNYCNDLGGTGLNAVVRNLYNATLLRLSLRLADRIVTSSPHYPHRSPHLRRYAAKTVVIPPGVDTSYFRPLDLPRASHTLFFLGMLGEHHRYKGLESLLQAVAVLRDRLPDICLVVAGKGPPNNRFARLATRLGLQNHVRFLGVISDDEVRTWYNRCTVFVLPSLTWRQEGFGMAAVEAMACGTPTIVSSVVGSIERVREYDAAAIVEPDDHLQLAQTIEELFADDERRRQLGANGRRLATACFTWEQVAAQTLQLYEELCRRE